MDYNRVTFQITQPTHFGLQCIVIITSIYIYMYVFFHFFK